MALRKSRWRQMFKDWNSPAELGNGPSGRLAYWFARIAITRRNRSRFIRLRGDTVGVCTVTAAPGRRRGRQREREVRRNHFPAHILGHQPGAFHEVHLRILRDDGAVESVNGAEVFRTNMSAA
jgi:hypothetical protein